MLLRYQKRSKIATTKKENYKLVKFELIPLVLIPFFILMNGGFLTFFDPLNTLMAFVCKGSFSAFHNNLKKS